MLQDETILADLCKKEKAVALKKELMEEAEKIRKAAAEEAAQEAAQEAADDDLSDEEIEAALDELQKSPVAGRWGLELSAEQEEGLARELVAENTLRSRGTWMRAFLLWTEYRQAPAISAEMDLPTFAELLGRFLCQARKQDGKPYAPSSLKAAFNALCAIWADVHPEHDHQKTDWHWTSRELAHTRHLLQGLQARLLGNPDTPLPSKASEFTDEEIHRMVELPMFDSSTPEGLMSKLLLVFCILFGKRISWYHNLPLPFLVEPQADPTDGRRYYSIGYYIDPKNGQLKCNAPGVVWDKNHKRTNTSLR